MSNRMSRLHKAAKVALTDLVRLEEDEEVLIVANPGKDIYPIALALFEEANALKAKPAIVVQNDKTVLDNMERVVVESIGTMPDVLLSISADEFGEDPYGYHVGYVARDGQKYDDIYNKVTAGDKMVRGFQCPGVTVDMFERLVPVDYSRMRDTAIRLKKAIDGHREIHVTAPSGTDVRFSIEGREATRNNGDALSKGSFGNIPAGEVYISPVVGSANGKIAFDGTTMLIRDSIIPKRPIEVTLKDGFVTEVAGGRDAEKLMQTIRKGEEIAREIGRKDYERNARHLGGFGIGINEYARITGHILEDEKALKTIHFAIGANYDFDANAIIHQDCLVMNPTVRVDGRTIMKNGDIIV